MASSTKIAEKLFQNGIITKSQLNGAMRHYNNYGGYIEESLIETNILDEDKLVKSLAQIFKTRFVTTAKLKKANIGQKVLTKLPSDFVIKHNVFPILFDEDSKTISIVTIDPEDLDLEKQICTISKALKVRSFVARPLAIKAAISKFYKGDIHAFVSVDKNEIKAFQNMMDVYERNLLDEGLMAAAVAETNTFGQERTLTADDLVRKDKRAGSSEKFGVLSSGGLPLEVAKVLVSLLESIRGELSGHSVLTANYSEKLSKKIGLSDWEVGAITMAALLHDIGKGEPYHLTAFNVAEWDGHRTNAMKRYETPTRLLESANLPVDTVNALKSMYERFDGNGFPSGLKNTEIPLGARIIAIADTYADLTSNPRNPYRQTLDTNAAIEVLKKGKNNIFDNNLVDLFSFIVTGDDIKRQLLTGVHTVMVIDSDAEQCAVLEMQLTTRGFKVITSRSADDAIKYLLKKTVHLILSEVELKPFNGFELKNRLNDNSRTEKIPFFYFTEKSAATDVEKGFALGAQDYLVKPSSIDVVAAKISKFLQRAAPAAAVGGVSGSLKEMSIPDLVQILSHGRKTGQLKLSFGNRHNGEVHFIDGEIYNALFDQIRGEEAFFAMLKFKEGSFSLNPDFTSGSKVINMTSEMLLLEGMRRMDEDNR